MKTVTEAMAQVEARIDEIIAAGREELTRLAHLHHATEAELELMLDMHDAMQGE
jgi:hypothetical protein